MGCHMRFSELTFQAAAVGLLRSASLRYCTGSSERRPSSATAVVASFGVIAYSVTIDSSWKPGQVALNFLCSEIERSRVR